LISMSPSYKKLKNPILRKTVAKVATLRQVARVGNISVARLVNELRNAVGQEIAAFGETPDRDDTELPEWFDESKIVRTIDARPTIEAGEQPINMVFSALGKLEKDEILALITPFNPAPLIEMAGKKGFNHYQVQKSPNEVLTYFLKADE